MEWPPPPPDRPALAPSDFKAEIAAQQAASEPGPAGVPSPCAHADTDRPAGPAFFDPSALTVDALARAICFPFYVLAQALWFLGIAPDTGPVTDVGKKRSPELAKAAYPIYAYLAEKYLGAHPDQVVTASLHITILDAIGLGPDLIEAVRESRRRAAVATTNGPGNAPGPAVV